MKIAIIGAGNMGGAIASRLLESGVFRKRNVLVTGRKGELLHALETRGAVVESGNNAAIARSNIVLLAVKPGDMESVCTEIAKTTHVSKYNGQLVISIAAGITIAELKGYFGSHVIRAMPNIGASVGEGFTAIAADARVGRHERRLAQIIFGAIGRYAFVEEDRINVLTAISGSGPAFIFRLAGVLEEIGRAHGLERSLARLVAAQMLVGSGRVLQCGVDIESLVRGVASPGGTTEAGLQEAERLGLEHAFREAILKANGRARELGGKG